VSTRPLLVTSDPLLLDDLLRLAAAGGVEVDVAHDVPSARRTWARAPLVLLGHDLAAPCARSRLPRRPQVVLVGGDLDDAGVWQIAVEVGAEHVVFLPDAEPWLATTLAEAVDGLASTSPLVAVLGGRGGSGATVLACALAVSAVRRDLRALLIDGDPLGGGIDLVFGAEQQTGLRWPDLGATRGRVPGAALTEALPQVQGLGVLSWDRGESAPLAGEAVRAVLTAARRTHDLIVVDLPRALDEAGREVLETATSALLVVPAEVRAAAAASRVAASAGLLCHDLRVVVRGPGPAGVGADAVARALGLPLAGQLKPEPGLELALERGEAPGSRPKSPLGSLCDALLDALLPSERRLAA